MTETLYRSRLERQGLDNEEIEEQLDAWADRKHDERRDRELEDQHILKLAELYQPYD